MSLIVKAFLTNKLDVYILSDILNSYFIEGSLKAYENLIKIILEHKFFLFVNFHVKFALNIVKFLVRGP